MECKDWWQQGLFNSRARHTLHSPAPLSAWYLYFIVYSRVRIKEGFAWYTAVMGMPTQMGFLHHYAVEEQGLV